MIWIYDIEQYPNMHMCIFRHRDTDEVREFIIWAGEGKEFNQVKEYQEFLRTEVKGMIGYNNIGYDYHLIDAILTTNPTLPTSMILPKLDSISTEAVTGKGIWLPEYKHRIRQLDLYKIWHFDNVARATSLKSLQVAMRWPNVQDLPYPPGTYLTWEMVLNTKKYCLNDVDSTKAFYQESIDMIHDRKLFQKTFGFRCDNYSSVKIGEKINAQIYERNTGIPYRNFKKLRTYRSVIPAADCIADFIEFKSDFFKDFLNRLRNVTFKPEDEMEFHLWYGGKLFTMAKGGLHSDDAPGVIVAGDDDLQEDDVASMYPACLINNGYYPAHLGTAWLEGMRSNYLYRKNELKPTISKLKKTGLKDTDEYRHAKSMSDGLKLGMNGGGFGKTNSIYSWQYDPLVTFQTTITGQLSLLMLIEAYVDAGIEVVSANTDGVVTRVRPEQRPEYHRIRDWWQDVTKFELERTGYEKIIFSNVNHYIAHIKSGDWEDLKFKGWFEINKEWHKNHSKRVVAIALANYFINGVPVQDTITNHMNTESYQIGPKTFNSYGIYDFCITQKVGKGMEVFWGSEQVQRINRYYVSKTGKRLTKHKSLDSSDISGSYGTLASLINDSADTGTVKRVTSMLKRPVQIFNRYVHKDDYEIDYGFYIDEAMKKIVEIDTPKLF